MRIKLFYSTNNVSLFFSCFILLLCAHLTASFEYLSINHFETVATKRTKILNAHTHTIATEEEEHQQKEKRMIFG